MYNHPHDVAVQRHNFRLNHGDPSPLSQPHLTNIALSELTDKPCGRVTSGIQEPQLTRGTSEGHIAKENIKCQERQGVQRKGMWPTWHYCTRGCRCPKMDFTFIRQAHWLQ